MNVKQGIEGYVYRVSGNQMPSPDAPPSRPRGVKTKVYVYELTNIQQVVKEGQGAFYRSINTKFIKVFETNSKGFFRVALQPGKYSLFTKKDNLFYANIFDGKNNIAPIEVLPKALSKVEIKVDYDATY
jgi:hypothetical protein